MKKVFDRVSVKVSRDITTAYSTSFSLGILALAPSIRPAIYAIYGYVRLADEIVDSFHEHNKAALLRRYEEQTWEALEEKISLNPVLNSFQNTVHQYRIDRQLIVQFLRSMNMDLEQVEYNSENYAEYILGSAEVVGLMCLKVFAHGDDSRYRALKPSAMKLGSAFQKVNFLRDLKDDYQLLGRTYFPGVNFEGFDNSSKRQIEQEIDDEFREALTGIRQLPQSSRFGVYLAFRYYRTLFSKIRRLPPSEILLSRTRITNRRKLVILVRSYVSSRLGRI
ncbi:MAG: phytoene/squalene synthase family protein [Chitinophagaceae bacterium]|nr:MAG: phytoene/squalene synthase family protein [Chitinophagaceae bacterium]